MASKDRPQWGTCGIPECNRFVGAKHLGMCSAHAQRYRRGTDLYAPLAPRTVRTGCEFPNCEGPHYGRGYCVNHCIQLRKGGPLRPLPRKMTRENRFWTRVDRGADDECWTWNLALHKSGYATFSWQGKSFKAHRVAYELSTGITLSPTDIVDHKCRNRACCNPCHLHLVTSKENAENIGLYKNSPSGYRGVTPRGTGKWRARVGHRGRVIHIGDFRTPEDANDAVIEARLKLHTNNLTDRRDDG